MRTLKIRTAIVALVLYSNGEELKLELGVKPDIDVMNYRSAHLSGERCDYFNHKAGRDMAWEGNHKSFADTEAVVDTMEIVVDTIVERAREKPPAWVVELQEKGTVYHDQKMKSAEKYKGRLSGYSPTELLIAKSMGLLPWNIDRNQLRKWAKETPR